MRTAVLAASLAVCAGCAYAALGVAVAMRLAPALAASLTLGAAVLGAATQGVTQEGSALAALAWVIPDLSLFSIADAAYTDAGQVPLAYLGGVALWTGAYATGTLVVGALLLDRRELG